MVIIFFTISVKILKKCLKSKLNNNRIFKNSSEVLHFLSIENFAGEKVYYHVMELNPTIKKVITFEYFQEESINNNKLL